jgi:hypothetical protein
MLPFVMAELSKHKYGIPLDKKDIKLYAELIIKELWEPFWCMMSPAGRHSKNLIIG